MKTLRIGLCLAVSAVVVVPLAAQAATPPPKKVTTALTAAQAAQPVGTSQASSSGASALTEKYWTRDRLLSARPVELPSVSPSQARRIKPQPTGAAGQVAPAPAAGPSTPAPASTTDGSLWTGNAKTTGKVFFTDSAGYDYVCSASTVDSASKLVVWTAAHCMFDISFFCDSEFGFHRNWIYVPGYTNGAAPLGEWTAKELWVPRGYCDGTWPEAIPYDSGAAVMNLNGGSRVAAFTGANGISWNQPASQTILALGYPQAAPFNGQTLRYCYGGTFSDPVTGARGMSCAMTGGASGGPWLRAYNSSSGLGYLNGDSSYKMTDDPSRLYAAYFGNAQAALYNLVRNRYAPPPPPVLRRAALGDFTGDGKADITVYRPATGTWFVRGLAAVQYGQAADRPAAADYNGDGRVDIAVYRPSNGTWYVRGAAAVAFGVPGDTPLPGDYNGDKKADLAVYRPATGTWYVRGVTTAQFGAAGDIPVPADYNGDGRTDLAVFRPSTSTWFVRGVSTVQYGASGDVPVVADYNGDSRADIATYRRSSGTWFVRGLSATRWGGVADIPVPADYVSAYGAEPVVYRPAATTWYVRGLAALPFGAARDVPAVLSPALRQAFFGLQ